MKKLLLVLVLGAPLLFGGCAGTPDGQPVNIERQVYLTFRDTWTLTLTAYDGYCERAVQGKISIEDQIDVDNAWNNFRNAFSNAFLIASRDWSAITPEDVNKLSNDVRVLILSL